LRNFVHTKRAVKFLRIISNLFRFNRTNWKAVALCFLAAMVFWLFSALNKEHDTNISFPLQFEYDHDRFVAVEIPQQVQLNVSGIGWDLLRKSLGVKLQTLSITLERPTEVKKIVGSTLPPVLASQIGALKINHVVNDTLFVEVDSKDTHTFRLVADLTKVTFRNGYGRISPVVILPDSVQLEGPKGLLHDLPDSIVLSMSKSKVDENVREELEVQVAGDELLKRNPPVVEVRFEVGEVKEIPWKLKLMGKDKKVSWRVDGLPDSVSCRMVVPIGLDLTVLKSPNVHAFVELNQAIPGNFVVLPRASGLPPAARIVTMDSVSFRLY